MIIIKEICLKYTESSIISYLLKMNMKQKYQASDEIELNSIIYSSFFFSSFTCDKYT